MGLIKAAASSMNSTLADQWKEYFICDGMDNTVLIKRGYKQQSGRTSNTKGNDSIVSNGSIIAVNEGQAMMIVEDGLIVEFSAEPGVFTYDSSTESSVFEGKLTKGIVDTFKTMAKRFEFGGDTAKNQKIYYFNLKELAGNKFGTKEPIMYDDYVYQSITLRFFGKVSLVLDDPMKLYKSIASSVEDEFLITDYWKTQLSAEFLMYLSQAMAKLAQDKIKYNQITQHQIELATYMNEVLDADWHEARGLLIQRVAIESVSLDPEDKDKIEKIDEMRLMSNITNASGRMTAAAANAMESAGANEGGAMMGFAGLNMAVNQSAGNVTNMHQMAAEQAATAPQTTSNIPGWTCSCGSVQTGNFCSECGATKQVASTWTCTCGTLNEGNFCSNCGSKKPESNSWQCSCGTSNDGKFCSNCGSSK